MISRAKRFLSRRWPWLLAFAVVQMLDGHPGWLSDLRSPLLRLPGVPAASAAGPAGGAGASSADSLFIPWGATVLGMQVKADIDTVFLSRNGTMGVKLRFRYDWKKGPKAWTSLLHNPMAGLGSIEFRNRKTGKVYERFRTPPGYQELFSPADYFDLKGILVPQEFTIRLLSAEGEMIPAGQYDLTAVYANEKAMELDAFAKNYEGRLWTGRVRSNPLPFTLHEIPPLDIYFSAYDSLTATNRLPVVSWRWDFKTSKRTKVTIRPGFIPGRTEQAVLLFPKSERSIYSTVDGSVEVRPESAANVLQGRTSPPGQPPPPLPFSPDSLVGIRIYEDVFETSVPVVHDWKPKTGDFKVLWSKTVITKLKPPSDAK